MIITKMHHNRSNSTVGITTDIFFYLCINLHVKLRSEVSSAAPQTHFQERRGSPDMTENFRWNFCRGKKKMVPANSPLGWTGDICLGLIQLFLRLSASLANVSLPLRSRREPLDSNKSLHWWMGWNCCKRAPPGHCASWRFHGNPTSLVATSREMIVRTVCGCACVRHGKNKGLWQLDGKGGKKSNPIKTANSLVFLWTLQVQKWNSP